MSDVIKNLRNGADRAAFEAGRLVRLQRAQLERRTQEQQRRQSLEQLGEAVWRLYAQGRVNEPELVSLCHQVQTATHQIVELQKTVARLRQEQAAGPSKCLDCGHDLGEGDTVCPFCGAARGAAEGELDLHQEVAGRVCTGCGRPLRAGAAFCGRCGQRQA